jgi:hypothetical protein
MTVIVFSLPVGGREELLDSHRKNNSIAEVSPAVVRVEPYVSSRALPPTRPHTVTPATTSLTITMIKKKINRINFRRVTGNTYIADTNLTNTHSPGVRSDFTTLGWQH